ncbi:MAG: CRISPR-associated protein Cas4 [Candidatus Dojkabacteria bacterium]
MLTGTLISYYLICKRKCYLHYHNLKFEDNSELVKIGKYLHEQRQQKLEESGGEKGSSSNAEILLEGIKIDSIEGEYVVEYKKKNSSEEAARAQLLYYLYTLQNKGVSKKGLLKFKESKGSIEVELTEENQAYISDLIKEIKQLLSSEDVPPVINHPKCKKCAFYEYCYIT